MKELSIEEKAKRYDESFGKARRYYDEYKTRDNILYVEDMEDIFPELKEGEDDRIRKGIIRNLEYLMDRAEGFVKDELKERIAWLEKKGEKGTNGNEREIPNSEQKPAWSEEDEKILATIIEKGYLKPSERQWLKSPKDRVQPQPKEECGKEDLSDAVECLREYAEKYVRGGNSKQYVLDLASRIESLSLQNRWKPSDRELGAILTAIGDERQKGSDVAKDLLNIYQHLKKLR